MRRE
jgi:hypothetical protein